MSDSTLSQQLLQILKQQTDSMSISDILELIDTPATERTIRRQLQHLVEERLITKTGKYRGTRYQINTPSIPVENIFSKTSLEIIEQVRLPLYKRTPVSYNHDWVQQYQPNQTYYLPTEIRQHLLKIGLREQDSNQAGTYAQKIHERLMIDLSYNSSRLEGNTYSLIETKRLLLEGTPQSDKLDEEKTMILNHKEAIRYIINNAQKTTTITSETIRTVHYLLSDGLVEKKYSGYYRDHGVRIGGSTYIPIENPMQLEKQADKIGQIASNINDPYEQSFFLLVHIAYLQAFHDVNKRTSRICANIPLVNTNRVPLSFNDIENSDYNSAMISVYEYNQVQPLVDLFYFSYQRSCLLYDASVESIGFNRIQVQYRKQRKTALREIILTMLIDDQLSDYLTTFSKQEIAEADQAPFIDSVLEDIAQLDVTRIAGIGISREELERYLKESKDT